MAKTRSGWTIERRSSPRIMNIHRGPNRIRNNHSNLFLWNKEAAHSRTDMKSWKRNKRAKHVWQRHP